MAEEEEVNTNEQAFNDQTGAVVSTEKAWAFLREPIPNGRHKRALNKSVYGIEGLTDIADWFLWERLEKSGLRWELEVTKVTYLGSEHREVRRNNAPYMQTWYLVAMEGVLLINGRPFPCMGASENRRIDGAYKGALTSLFKNGCKWAGLTMSVYKEAPIDDDYFDSGDPAPTPTGNNNKPPVEPRSVAPTQPTGHTMETVQHAVDKVAGTIISDTTPAKPATPTHINLAVDFEHDEASQRKIVVLQEFNNALPAPNSENWVQGIVSLWLVKNENHQLDPDMADKKSPINYAWSLLLAMHGKQCQPKCSHAQEFYDKLKAIK